MGQMKRQPLADFKKYTNAGLFLAVSTAGILLTFLYWILSGNGTAVFDWLVLGESNSWELADFFRHIGYSADLRQTYWVSRDACFPPLTYLFFHLLYRMNIAAFSGLQADDWQGFVLTPYAILLYVMFVAVFAVLFLASAKRITGLRMEQAVALGIVLLLSYPFFTALERGNPVLMVVLLLTVALYWMQSEVRWKREAALILIVIAVNLKLYPAILGLLYLKERRIRELLRLILYTALLFVVPCAFTGGFPGFLQYMDVLLHGHYNAGFMREWSSIRGACYIVGGRFGLTDSGCVRMGQILENLFLALSVFGIWKSRKRWVEVFFLSAIMCFYMPTSWVYNTVYLVLPLLFFLREKSAGKKWDRVYAVLFGLIFTLPIWCLTWNPGAWVCWVAYGMWGMMLVCELSKGTHTPN